MDFAKIHRGVAYFGIGLEEAVPLTAAEARAVRLQEVDGCILDCECACGRTVQPAVKMLLRRYSEQHRLGDVVKRITCQQCRAHPTIYLCENHRRKFCYGGRPGWSLQVWPEL